MAQKTKMKKEKDGALLEFRHVSFGYGRQKILNDISFRVRPGSVMTLLGPSGSGKTTLLRLALGLEKPNSGDIFLNGQLVSSPQYLLPPEKRGLGLLFQDIALFPHLNVYDNIAFGLRAKKDLSLAQKKERVRDMVAKIGFDDSMLRRYPHQLSGGEQQRVALARALAPHTVMVLMDEPFSSLNERKRDEIRDWVLHFLESNNIAALLVTHSAEEAMFMSDEMAVLHHQKLQQWGSPLDLYYQPKDSFVAGIFGEINSYQGRVQQGMVTTPLGNLPAPTIYENKMVEVVIRADAIALEKTTEGKDKSAARAPHGRVMEVRFLGNHLLVHWQTTATNGVANNGWHVHSRLVTRHDQPLVLAAGDWVRSAIDPKGFFIFPL